MTNIERRMAFVHAILCSMNDDMNWLCRLVRGDKDDEDWSEGMKKLRRLVIEASDSIEEAHLEAQRLVDANTIEVQRLVNENTVWSEDGKVEK